MRLIHWRYGWMGALLLALLLPLHAQPTPPAAAQERDLGARCFPETGQCIAGAVRVYWEDNGGLAVFGYPITPLQIDTVEGWTGPVQWFERDRLEDHAAQGVLAGRLGVRLLELQNRPWQTSFEGVNPLQVPTACRYFAETGHSLCPPFRDYWEANGGLARFGFPITEPLVETIGNWTGLVQYFERRRMELHNELPGLPVLLGLLGNEVLNFQALPPTPPDPGLPQPGVTPECVRQFFSTSNERDALFLRAYEQLPFRAVLGCPRSYVRDVNAAFQNFERGEMAWLNLSTRGAEVPFTMANRFIYGVFPGPTFQRYNDTWVAGIDPMRPNVRPPRRDLYAPWGGFGKLWINDSTIRERLGWATEREARENLADVVIFDNIYNDLNNLGVMFYDQRTGKVYAFGRLDQPTEVMIVR